MVPHAPALRRIFLILNAARGNDKRLLMRAVDFH